MCVCVFLKLQRGLAFWETVFLCFLRLFHDLLFSFCPHDEFDFQIASQSCIPVL